MAEFGCELVERHSRVYTNRPANTEFLGLFLEFFSEVTAADDEEFCVRPTLLDFGEGAQQRTISLARGEPTDREEKLSLGLSRCIAGVEHLRVNTPVNDLAIPIVRGRVAILEIRLSRA